MVFRVILNKIKIRQFNISTIPLDDVTFCFKNILPFKKSLFINQGTSLGGKEIIQNPVFLCRRWVSFPVLFLCRHGRTFVSGNKNINNIFNVTLGWLNSPCLHYGHNDNEFTSCISKNRGFTAREGIKPRSFSLGEARFLWTSIKARLSPQKNGRLSLWGKTCFFGVLFWISIVVVVHFPVHFPTL